MIIGHGRLGNCVVRRMYVSRGGEVESGTPAAEALGTDGF